MATKTLILRPTGIHTLSNFEAYPSDIEEENCYLLVNEKNADDDATYIKFSAATNSSLFKFNLNSIYTTITPKKIRVIVKTKTSSSNTNSYPRIRADIDSINGDNSEFHNLTVTNYDVYETYKQEINDFIGIWQRLKENQYCIAFLIGINSTSSGKNATADIRLTQLYLEIEYESNGDIYIKQDNSWKMIDGVVCKKKNNQWVLSDPSIFQNEDHFNIKTI